MEEWQLADIWRELHLDEKRFSLHTVRSTNMNVFSRVDYFLISDNLRTHVVDANIGISFQSDHSPVSFTIDTSNADIGKSLWKFPKYLLTDPVYPERVRKGYTHYSTGQS